MARSQKQRLREQRRREEARTAEMKARQRAGQHRNEPPKATWKREPQERFVVDPNRTWHVVRTLPRWSARAAEQVRAVGIPVFEAREAQRLVSEIGKARVALVPILRRLLFVGTAGWQELQKVETHPGIYDNATGYRRSGVAVHDGRAMTIAPNELQVFADCVTGWSAEVDRALRILFAIGETIRVADGPFASFSGTVEEIDVDRSRMKVAVDMFGRSTPVELDFTQVRRGNVSA